MADEIPEEEIRQKTREGIPLIKNRDKKLRKKKQRMQQHGKGLGKIYRNAITKRGETKKNYAFAFFTFPPACTPSLIS